MVLAEDTACAIYTDQSLTCWNIWSAQGGDDIPQGDSWIAIGVGSGTKTCGITTNNEMYCWERIEEQGTWRYVTPQGTSDSASTSILADDVVELQMDDSLVCASSTAGVLKCWIWQYNNLEGESSPSLVGFLPTVDDAPVVVKH